MEVPTGVEVGTNLSSRQPLQEEVVAMDASDEAMLSARERAVLAQLEARAAADDPRWASQLGAAPARRAPDAARLLVAVAQRWAALRAVVWGPVLLVVGVAVAVAGVGAGLAVGLVGVAAAAAGLGLLARLALPASEQGRPPL
ncbi:MAG TPA: DUF3040 domain-containing protein [Acidimicrobiales bacterium]|nr:DUF3040 domain-containing protein [Acidimicrobiales bacterium]